MAPRAQSPPRDQGPEDGSAEDLLRDPQVYSSTGALLTEAGASTEAADLSRAVDGADEAKPAAADSAEDLVFDVRNSTLESSTAQLFGAAAESKPTLRERMGRMLPGKKSADSGREDVPLENLAEEKLTQEEIERLIRPTPEPNAGFLSRLTYSWLDNLLMRGYRKPLEDVDLFRLDEAFLSELLANDFEARWRLETARAAERGQPPSIARVLSGMFGRRFAWAGVLKLLSDVTQLGSPIVAMYLIQFIESFQDGATPQAEWIGYFLTVLLFLLQIIGSLLLNAYFLVCMWIGMRARATLVSVVYRKVLRLDDAARIENTTGRVINLVSTDCSRIDALCAYLHVVWSGPFQLIVIIALLFWQLHAATAVALGLLVLMTVVQAVIMKSLMRLRRENAKHTDARVRQVNELVGGIRVIKFFAWEPLFSRRVTDTRHVETQKIRSLNILRALVQALAFGVPAIASALCYVVYAVTNNMILNPSIVFSSLAYFNLLRFPMMMIPYVVTQLADAKVALSRLRTLLEASELSPVSRLVSSDSVAIRITDGTFVWASEPAAESEGSGGKEKLDSKRVPSDAKEASEEAKDAAEKAKEAAEKAAKEDAPTLQNISCEFPKGKLTAVVGTVGSAKSSLLAAITGEIKCLAGSIDVSGSIGYTAQQAWIMNATLRENILFGRPLDEKRYQRVLDVCQLRPDLKILPSGDETEIGERGINLSGGQKQRVNLARCVYRDQDIVLMDDPLSAVDAHVGRALFEQCILRELAGKTRVLVTHQLHVLAQTDHVIVLRDGRIAEQGTFSDLMAENGAFAELMRNYGGSDEAIDDEPVSPSVAKASTDATAVDPASRPASTTEKTAKAKESQMTAEERAVGGVDWPVFLAYFRAAGGYVFASGMLVLLVVAQAARVLNDMWLVWWSTPVYENGAQVGNGQFPLTSGVYIGVYIMWALLQVATTFAFGALFCVGGCRASVALHYRALDRVLHAPTRFFDQTPLGRILNRFSKDTDALDNTLPDAFRMFIMTLGTAFATLVLIIVATPLFLAPLVPLMIVYGLVQNLYRHSSREVKRIDSIARSPLYAHFGETLSGLATIRAYGDQSRFETMNERLMDRANRPYYVQIVLQRWLGLRLESIGALLVLFAGLFGVLARESINPSLLGLSLSYVLQITGTLNWCVRQFTETEIQMNAVERIDHYAEELEVEAPPIVPDNRPPPNWPSTGAIEFRNVAMRYRPGQPLILHDLSFAVRGGEKIGVVGRTGAGKSSIMAALFRVAELASGSVIIDGIDVSRIGLGDLRGHLGIIPQDPVLFQGTVRSNLDPDNAHSDADVWAALDQASLRAAVAKLPGQLDTPVADAGSNFSVGQRQLLCLARAMLRRPRICILDEATANVDYETDAAIQTALRAAFTDATVLTIAHRINTIIDYDRILVLERGRLVEFGSPAELLARPSGAFSAMIDETGPTNATLLRRAAQDKSLVSLADLKDLS